MKAHVSKKRVLPSRRRNTKTPKTKVKAIDESAPRIPARWRWHYRRLSDLRHRLIEERRGRLSDASEPIESHSMSLADSATDEFDHELALSQLSAEQNALYEIEAALRRITAGTYGVCEQSGKPIPAERLKAIPWARFRQEVAAQLETSGMIERPRLGTLQSVREKPLIAATLERRNRGSIDDERTNN